MGGSQVTEVMLGKIINTKNRMCTKLEFICIESYLITQQINFLSKRLRESRFHTPRLGVLFNATYDLESL